MVPALEAMHAAYLRVPGPAVVGKIRAGPRSQDFSAILNIVVAGRMSAPEPNELSSNVSDEAHSDA